MYLFAFMTTTKTIKQAVTPMKSIAISNALTSRLEEFAQIVGVTADQLAGTILEREFAPDNYMETLRRYIAGRYSKAQADKLANSYNAFAKAEAERTGRLLGHEAKVECYDGAFHLYFPVIKSVEVRRAMRAADPLFPSRQFAAA
jgi:hypothetical protein